MINPAKVTLLVGILTLEIVNVLIRVLFLKGHPANVCPKINFK